MKKKFLMNDHKRKEITARVKTSKKDWYQFIQQVKESLSEIKFKGIQFTHMGIDFQISATDIGNTASMTVSFWNSALSSEEQKKNDRHFIVTGSEDSLSGIFDQIETWKEDMINNHTELLRQQQSKLFQ